MAQMMDHIDYLTQEIGPRPAGTEEEQEAALYITEQFQQEAGFSTEIEEFTSTTGLDTVKAVLAIITVIAIVLAIITPMFAIPLFFVSAITAALYTLEEFDHPFVSRFFKKGASQNVVAKYQPGTQESARRGRSRKIIVVAHYDTGKVKPGIVDRVESSGIPMGLICVIGMIAAAFFLLIRVFVASGGGMALLVLNVLSIIALIVCLVPIVKMVLMRMAPYNEGANNNATGTAALIEVARRISNGSLSEAELAEMADDDVTIHGEQAAREAGLVPEGAQIVYEAEQLVPPAELGEYDDEERLLSAKAAIAAFTGMPVERKVYGSVAEKLVNSRAEEQEYHPEGLQVEDLPPELGYGEASWEAQPQSVQEEPVASGYENAPSWFVAAQNNARRHEDASEEPIANYRSKYTEAFDRAERERAEREAAQAEAERLAREEEARAREEAVRAALAANAQAQAEAEEQARAQEQARIQAQAALQDILPKPMVQLEEPAVETVVEVELEADEIDAAIPVDPIVEVEPLEASAEPAGEDASADEVAEDAAVLVIPEIPDDLKTPEPEPIVVPEVVSAPKLDVDTEPEDEEEQDYPANPGITARHERIAALPSTKSGPDPVTSPSRSGLLRTLRTTVPSVSGSVQAVAEAEPEQDAGSLEDLPVVGRHASQVSVPSVIPEVGEVPEAAAPSLDIPAVISTDEAPEGADAESLKSSTIAMAPIDYNMEIPLEEIQAALNDLPDIEPEPAPEAPSAPAPVVVPLVTLPTIKAAKIADDDDIADAAVDDDLDVEEMPLPRSRAGSLLDRFRRNKGEELSDTPQEWLDVDEDFEARSVGKKRGSWASFRDEQDLDDDEAGYDGDDADLDEPAGGEGSKRKWFGGAFRDRLSRFGSHLKGGGDDDQDFDEEYDEEFEDEEYDDEVVDGEDYLDDDYDDYDEAEPEEDGPRDDREDEGSLEDAISTFEDDSEEKDDQAVAVDKELAREIEQIYHFRNPQFNTEIWFVAIGSDGDSHDGAKAFIEEHRDELRGCMFVEVESLGAGDLSVASDEGRVSKVVASSRVKRFTREATAATGIALDHVSLSGTDSIASTVQRAGFQAMHLFGAENGRPALKGSADDVIENVDDLLLDEYVNYLYELLKS